MSKVICIAGESGSGKTTSMRNLDPETTMYIDCDKKGLSWKGWRNQYNGEKKNYLKTDFPQVALQALKKIDKEEQYKHIRVVVVDTINGLMIADEMRRCKEKGYDKWQDLAQSIYDLIDYSNQGFATQWGDNFGQQFKNKLIGGVFGPQMDYYNDKELQKRVLRWFISVDRIADATVPELSETQAYKNHKNGYPAGATPSGDGFMNVPDGVDEELPFN